MKSRKLLCMSLALALALQNCNVASAAAFKDVKESDWFYEAVNFAYDHNVMKGNDLGEFMPASVITKAEMCTMIYNMASDKEISDFANIYNVEEGAWYADAIKWALSKSIISPNKAVDFGATGSLTREDVAYMLFQFNSFERLLPDTINMEVLDKFKDKDLITEESLNAMAWASTSEILVGASNDNSGDLYLNPKHEITRSEVATVIQRFIGKIPTDNASENKDKEDNISEMVSKNADIATITENEDGTVTVSLPGNITTGYTWYVSKTESYDVSSLSVANHVEVSDSTYVSKNNNPNLLGAGGTFEFNLKGLSSGRCAIVFEYRRPFESAENVANDAVLVFDVDDNNKLSLIK